MHIEQTILRPSAINVTTLFWFLQFIYKILFQNLSCIISTLSLPNCSEPIIKHSVYHEGWLKSTFKTYSLKQTKQSQYKHQILWVLLKQTCSLLEKSTESLQTHCEGLIWQGYNLGMSSLIEAILKNQFKQVSLAVSLTLSGEKLSGKKTTQK